MAQNIIELNLNKKVYTLICRRIKTKSHLIELLVEISSLIISNVQIVNDNYGKCIIRLENKKRIYFSINDINTGVHKHFSINFPFNIEEVNSQLKIETKYNSVEIQSYHLAVLRSICSNEGFNEKYCKHGLLLDFSQLVESIFNDMGMKLSYYESDINQILIELFTFEPGYIRFDYDVENENGRVHPLNHLDIFYSQHTTFKLGCSLLNLEEFIEILEPSNECEFIGG